MESEEILNDGTNGRSGNVFTSLWFGLALSLCVATFGIFGLLKFLIYVILFIAGFLIVLGYWSVKKSEEILASDDVRLLSYEEPYSGISAVFKKIEQAPQGFKYDKRLTGSSVIDELLQEIIQYFFRDYIHYWYNTISDDERFLYELHQTIQKVIINFAGRIKDVAWVPFLTTRLVDVFATHLRIFRITRERLESKTHEFHNNDSDENKLQEELDLEEMFFTVEAEVEKGLKRAPICLDDQAEMYYLQDIIEVLLYLLLPEQDFNSKGFRYFLREVIAKSIVLPSVDMICDPDYVNQTISWLLAKETTFTVDSFLTTIRFSDSIEDIEETKKKVDLEIAKLRSQDSDDSSQLEISVKKQLSSLMYVRKLCVTTMRRLKSGIADNMVPMDNEPEVDLLELLSPTQNIPKLSLKEILEDNTSLSYFIEYLGTYNAEHYVFFHLTIEGFRATAIQQLSILAEETAKAQNKKLANPSSDSFDQLKQAAANIYEEYLSPRASPRIVLDDQLIRKIVKDIKSNEPSGAYFDTAHMAVYKILESPKYYGSFLSSTAYLKCIDEMDLLNKCDDGNAHGSDDDTVSIASSSSYKFPPDEEVLSQPWTPDCDLRYSALIGQAGVITHEGKSYVNYTIHVCRTTSNGSRNWVVMRRYSDFHDLHMQLREKFPSLTWLNLPQKKTFGNFEEDFIEKRKNLLEDYIQPLLDTNLLAEHSGMFELVAGFLEQGDYYKGKSLLSRKMDHIVNPMKTSITNVSRAVRSRADTVTKWTGDLSDSLKPVKPNEKGMGKDLNIGKLSDAVDQTVDDNIPLRILILLMDEVFDLQHRNQWLRRQIVGILRQIVKATFGDRINRKIVEYVDFAASAQQVAEYVRHFRDSYWPGGVLAEAQPERSHDVKRRMRMVTKAKMIGGIPDDLKRFLGLDVTREGVTRVFDMFQHVNLNKRLFYVLAEAFLETTFPDNKFKELFVKAHSKRT